MPSVSVAELYTWLSDWGLLGISTFTCWICIYFKFIDIICIPCTVRGCAVVLGLPSNAPSWSLCKIMPCSGKDFRTNPLNSCVAHTCTHTYFCPSLVLTFPRRWGMGYLSRIASRSVADVFKSTSFQEFVVVVCWKMLKLEYITYLSAFLFAVAFLKARTES